MPHITDTDIVIRLRDTTEMDADAEEVTVPICDEAADEIERLRAHVASVEEDLVMWRSLAIKRETRIMELSGK